MTCTIEDGIYICDGYEDVSSFDLLYMSKDFQAPTAHEVSLVKIGDYIEVNNGGERFWTKVIYKEFSCCYFVATIQDDLKMPHPFSKGDNIKFHKFNIYSIRYV